MSEVKKEDPSPPNEFQTQPSPSYKQDDSTQPPEPRPVSEPTSQSVTQDQPNDRSELLARARSFLASPQVQHQDMLAKHAFLVEKGLHESEIADLLRSQVWLAFSQK